MPLDQTQQQSAEERRAAQRRSLEHVRPPTEVPGYEPRRFGAGAYGEVWVAVDRNTGRQVAIKFYSHRGGLDWSLLSREVEKLAFLSADRYVVQLLGVGWDAEPPYYVMEYVEQGSLEDLLRREGRLSVREAVELFREVAVGLLHAHGKGVLHCDLKPANVLVDQDRRPRLADFGQSRLSHEQTPALGTLFYMAPEQSAADAMPDVRWDVYALGALLYCMLTGEPPHRTPEAVEDMERAEGLDARLDRYRALVERSGPPAAYRALAGVDKALADIIDGCLAADPAQRFANVQAVLDALEARRRRRARRTVMILGAVSPAVVLVVMSFLGWRWFETVVHQSDQELRTRALESNLFAAKYAAKEVTNALDRRYRAVEEMAASASFRRLLEKVLDDAELARLRQRLSDPALAAEQRQKLRAQFLANPLRQQVQRKLEQLLSDESQPQVSSWFVDDPAGLQLAQAPTGKQDKTIGINYGWRAYFHGGTEDKPPNWRPGPKDHVTKTTMSNVFRSQATNRWILAISTPILSESGRMLGLVALTQEAGRFVELQRGNEQYAVLVDLREGPNKGLILQHPLFAQFDKQRLPDRFAQYRLGLADLPDSRAKRENYVDPLGSDPLGAAFKQRWLAEQASVEIRDGYTGWVVIVQQAYDVAIGRTLNELKSSLWKSALLAAVVIGGLFAALWAFMIRVLGELERASRAQPPGGDASIAGVSSEVH